MNKSWHTNKTKPNSKHIHNGFAPPQIIIVLKDDENFDFKQNRVVIASVYINEYGELSIGFDSDAYAWKDYKDYVKYWAYIDEYFKKELEN